MITTSVAVAAAVAANIIAAAVINFFISHSPLGALLGLPLPPHGRCRLLAVSLLSRFAPRAGLVIVRQTFVRRCQNCVARAAVITGEDRRRTSANGFWRLVGARYAVAAARHPATGLR